MWFYFSRYAFFIFVMNIYKICIFCIPMYAKPVRLIPREILSQSMQHWLRFTGRYFHVHCCVLPVRPTATLIYIMVDFPSLFCLCTSFPPSLPSLWCWLWPGQTLLLWLGFCHLSPNLVTSQDDLPSIQQQEFYSYQKSEVMLW